MTVSLYLFNRNLVSATMLNNLKDKLGDEQKQKLQKLSKSKQIEFVLSRSLLLYAIKKTSDDAANIIIHERSNLPPKVPLCEKKNIAFSISHSKDLIGVAISKSSNHKILELGMDIEQVPTLFSLEKAEFFCNAEQIKSINALEDTEKPAELIKLWTLKEAYFKANMQGVLNKTLKALSFIPAQAKKDTYCVNDKLSLNNKSYQISLYFNQPVGQIKTLDIQCDKSLLAENSSSRHWQQYDVILSSL